MNQYRCYAPGRPDHAVEYVAAKSSFAARTEYARAHGLNIYDVVALRIWD